MQLILKSKSHGIHIALDANNATDLIKIKALAEMLDISYPALKQRIFRGQDVGNDSNLLIVFYVQIVPDDFVMQLHRF